MIKINKFTKLKLQNKIKKMLGEIDKKC